PRARATRAWPRGSGGRTPRARRWSPRAGSPRGSGRAPRDGRRAALRACRPRRSAGARSPAPLVRSSLHQLAGDAVVAQLVLEPARLGLGERPRQLGAARAIERRCGLAPADRIDPHAGRLAIAAWITRIAR